MNKKTKTIVWVVIAVVLVAVIGLLFMEFISPRYTQIKISEFIAKVEAGEINEVNISSYKLEGLFRDANGTKNYYYCFSWNFYASNDAIVAKWLADGVAIDYANPNAGSMWSTVITVLGVVLVAVIFWLILRQASGGGKVMNVGKTKAHVQNNLKVRFADVAGAEEEKEELQEVVEFLKTPKKFSDLGARIPRGVLLVGPPGTGKTLFAKAVAGEAGVPFFSVSGSDFVEMYVGVGAARVRDLFDLAKKNQPCIIFVDEIDAVGRRRGAGLGGGHDEREQTLNQILVQMDGFETNEGVIVMAATNRADILDPALLRPGRFDRQIHVNLPDVKGREQILKVHARNKPIAPDVNFKTVARITAGFSGADLANLLNEAAILAARNGKKLIGNLELYDGINKVLMGPQKKSRVVTEADKRCTAYHEAGHAVLACLCKNCDPVHEVSIIPRGNAAGYTMTRPETDDNDVSYNKLVDNICMSLGGRVAEKLVLDDISTGASNDLERASKIARNMVTRYGFSEKLGPVVYGQDEGEIFLGRDISQNRNFSENVAAEIDVEVRELVDNAYESAKSILTDHMDQLHLVAKYVYHHEKIDGEEFRKIMTGEMEWSPEDLAPMPDTVNVQPQSEPEEQIPEQPDSPLDAQ